VALVDQDVRHPLFGGAVAARGKNRFAVLAAGREVQCGCWFGRPSSTFHSLGFDAKLLSRPDSAPLGIGPACFQ
jgi:predicted NAD/FAD-binding protein